MFESILRNTLSFPQWMVLLAIPPAILALYFLKLKRVPVEVPSTYLWRQTIEDLHVNSFWQRLRKSLLLLLQLLLIGLAIVALQWPYYQGSKLIGERFIFVIDNSASMSATDVEDADNRLALAKEKVGDLIDQMDQGMSAMIIAFADSTQVVQQLTSNRNLLRERLATIEPTAQTTDLAGALKLAGDLANPKEQKTVGGVEVEVVEPVATSLYLFTDGRFADVEGFALGTLTPYYVPIGSPESGNLAITAFSTRRNEVRPEEREAFVQVTNLSEQDQSFEVEIQLDGHFLDRKAADTPAGETASLSFRLADAPPGSLTASIDAEALRAIDDKLSVDDTAYAGLNEQRQGKVLLVTEGNSVLEAALTTGRAARLCELHVLSPGDLEGEEYRRAAISGEYSLIIYDGPQSVPKAMPRAHTFFIGAAPPTEDWRSGADEPKEPARFPQVLDWSRSHPLLAYVELSGLWIYETQILTPPKGASVLIEADAGPLMAISPRESYEDVVLAFPIIVHKDGATMGNTRWFKARSFPTFWLNTLDYLVGQLSSDAAQQASPGRAVEIRPRTNVAKIEVRTPSGDRVELERTGDAPFQFQDTFTPGVYEVAERGSVTQRFAVNLFNRAESDVRLREAAGGEQNVYDIQSIRIGHTDVEARGDTPARKNLWQVLLVAALAVLTFEWYVYNRRVYL